MTRHAALWTQLFASRVDLREVATPAFDDHIDSFGAAAEPALPGVRAAFGDELAPLAKDATGGVYACWSAGDARPIVYFGTEGNTHVIAPSEDAFLGMVAHRDDGDGELGLHDLMAYWHDALTALEAERPAARRGRLPPVDPAIASLVTAAGLPIVADPAATIEEANRAQLWPLLDRLDRIVTGYPARSRWRAAWNVTEPTARALSPQHTYAVGERVTYTWTYAWGSGEGRAVVLAVPEPGRVLLADRANVFVRDCG